MNIEAEQRAYLNAKPSRLGRGIERLTNPIGKTVAGFVPSGIVRQVVVGMDRASERAELASMDHQISDIRACRRAADRVERAAKTINASTGAAAGLGGMWTMSADIPATIGLALRNVRDTGRAYGFSGEGSLERLFRLQILELAALTEQDDRERAIADLEAAIADDGGLNDPEGGATVPFVDQAVERVSRAIAFAGFRSRAGMIVPVVGSVVGGIVNASLQSDVAKAARFAFQARRLKRDSSKPA